MKFKIRKCSQKLVVTFPDELAKELGWTSGDILAAEGMDGGLKIVRIMTAHDHAMEIARKGMTDYRETFETLAKS